MEDFNVYDINEKTAVLFKECFDINGSPKNIEKIKWQFLKNPTKKSFVDILFDKEKSRTAGIYAIFCVNFKIGKSLVLGAQSLDTLTDINYRGLGLFIKMAKDVQKKAEADNVGLIYGFPNGSSFPGFKKLLKWHSLDPLPFLIKPLRSRYFTKKISLLSFLPNVNLSYSWKRTDKDYVVTERDNFPAEAELIWKKFSKDIAVAVDRDLEYLNWRYIQKPKEKYQIAHCYGSTQNYLGYIIFTVKEKHDGIIGYIMELVYDIGQPKVGRLLMSYAIDKIKKQKADCILSWCLEHSPNYTVHRKEFFLPMPEKIRPIELHFAVRSLNPALDSFIKERKNWYISYSDSDTV